MQQRNTYNPGIIFKDVDKLPDMGRPVGKVKVLGKTHPIPARDELPTAADDALNNLAEYMEGATTPREFKLRECDLLRLILPGLPPSEELREKTNDRQRGVIMQTCMEAWAADAERRATDGADEDDADPLERQPRATTKGTSSGRRSKRASSRAGAVRGKKL